MSSGESGLFKKKKKKASVAQKKRRIIIDEETEDEPRFSLEELRDEQQYRRKGQGLAVEKLGKTAVPKKKEETELDLAFRGESTRKKTAEEVAMCAYVEAKMGGDEPLENASLPRVNDDAKMPSSLSVGLCEVELPPRLREDNVKRTKLALEGITKRPSNFDLDYRLLPPPSSSSKVKS